jgi:hypothetical protein
VLLGHVSVALQWGRCSASVSEWVLLFGMGMAGEMVVCLGCGMVVVVILSETARKVPSERI